MNNSIKFVKSKCLYCSQDACISSKTRNLCLLHYSRSNSILNQTNNNICTTSKGNNSNEFKISDQLALNNQHPMMESLWKEAITDVVLRMYELQKEEQECLRKDPLSMLSFNTTRINPSTLKMKNNRKRNHFSTGQDSRALNDTVLEAIRKTPRFSGLDMATAGKPVDEACPLCGKHEVIECYTATLSIESNVSKAETWGNKDEHKDSSRLIQQLYCNSCHNLL